MSRSRYALATLLSTGPYAFLNLNPGQQACDTSGHLFEMTALHLFIIYHVYVMGNTMGDSIVLHSVCTSSWHVEPSLHNQFEEA